MNDRMARLAALGLLILTGVGTAGFAADTGDRWEAEIRKFEALDRQQPPAPGGVLFYGSSSFRLWTDVAAAFPGLRVVNRGFGGSQLSDLNHYFERVVVPHAPRVLLVYGGDNDLASGRTPGQVLADFRDLVDRARRLLPRTRVVFVAVKPSPAREALLGAQSEANELVRRYARRARFVEFVDAATPLLDGEGRPDPAYFVGDRLHLNTDGYEQWRGVIGPRLSRWVR